MKKRYRVIKIVYAKNLEDAYRREPAVEPVEVSLDQEVTQKVKSNPMGFQINGNRRK